MLPLLVVLPTPLVGQDTPTVGIEVRQQPQKLTFTYLVDQMVNDRFLWFSPSFLGQMSPTPKLMDPWLVSPPLPFILIPINYILDHRNKVGVNMIRLLRQNGEKAY